MKFQPGQLVVVLVPNENKPGFDERYGIIISNNWHRSKVVIGIEVKNINHRYIKNIECS